MRRAHPRLLALVAGLAFCLFLVAGLPARLAIGWLAPAGLTVVDPQGSLWRGSVAAAMAGPLRLGPTSWSMSARSLLGGRLRAAIETQLGTAAASGTLELRLGGGLACEQCRYAGPAGALAGLLPMPQGLDARLDVDITRLELRERWPRRLIATLGVDDVPLQLPGLPPDPGLPRGSFVFSLDADPVPADGVLEARVRDAGGPLAIDGVLVLRPPGDYQLDARLRPQPGAPPRLAAVLQTLGPREADGSFSLGLAGSF